MGLFRDLDLRPVTLSVAPYTLRKYGAGGADLAQHGRDRIDQDDGLRMASRKRVGRRQGRAAYGLCEPPYLGVGSGVMADEPEREPGLERLDVFIGSWELEVIVPIAHNQVIGGGRIVFEWLEDPEASRPAHRRGV
jgi:hypothetical protein